eukprot:jgi/Ulvmu1/259/UM001_0263.1
MASFLPLPVQVTMHDVRDYFLGPRYADPRVADWPFMEWQLPMLITCGYVFGIPAGIWVMKDRQPLKVKRFAMLHNLFLFLLSLYMAIECVRQAVANFARPGPKVEGAVGFRLYCNPNDGYSPYGADTFSESGLALARVLYMHYISKAYEFVDTFIMILKKNNRQISFLHVYHHATTFFPVWWAVMKYAPGGDAWFCCFLNSSIHVLMYGYYLCASIGLRLSFVKPLITLSQMIQFLAFLYQGSMILIMNCYRPRVSAVLLVVQCAAFFALFTNFFIKTYVFRGKKTKKQ